MERKRHTDDFEDVLYYSARMLTLPLKKKMKARSTNLLPL
jgi:hypothetical protein